MSQQKNQTQTLSTSLNEQQPLPKTADQWKLEGNNFYSKIKNYSKAIEAYTKAIQINPNEPSYYSNRAACNILLKQYERVIEDCDKALNLHPKLLKGFYRKAVAHLNLLDFTKAIQNFEYYIQQDQQESVSKQLQDCINLQINYLKAVQSLNSDSELSNGLQSINIVMQKINNTNLIPLKIQLLAKTGDTSAAEALLKKINTNKTSHNLFLRALIQLNIGDRNRAKKYLTQSIDLDPTFIKANLTLSQIKQSQYLFDKGLQLFQSKKYKQSIEQYQQCLKHCKYNLPFKSWTYCKIGQALFHLNDFKQSLDTLKNSLQINIAHINLLCYQIRLKVLIQLKQFSEALQCIKKIKQIDVYTNYNTQILKIKELQKEGMNKTKDYYQMLEVSKNSSIDEIKIAYRNKIIEFLPYAQKTQNNSMKTNKYQILKAYQILTNNQLRQKYDNGTLKQAIDTQTTTTQYYYYNKQIFKEKEPNFQGYLG